MHEHLHLNNETGVEKKTPTSDYSLKYTLLTRDDTEVNIS